MSERRRYGASLPAPIGAFGEKHTLANNGVRERARLKTVARKFFRFGDENFFDQRGIA